MKLIVAKNNVNALTETNPNNFIFHSDYNTFKIIQTEVVTTSISSAYPGVEIVYEISHSVGYTPFVFGFVKFSNGRVGLPGTKDSANNFWFTSVNVLPSTIEFGFVNNTGSNYSVSMKYYICESPII